jgi:hypothetical protein
MPLETLSENPTAEDIHYRQAVAPKSMRGSFVIDDTDTHWFVADARGKGRLSVVVDIGGSTQSMTVGLYGMPDDTLQVGDTGVVQIGANFTVPSASIAYETANDPFPFFLVRCLSGAADAGNSTCFMWLHMAAF